MDDTPPLRRADDQRFEKLERKVDSVAVRVDEIRDWLIGEPESSALGRQLLSRAKANRFDIDKINIRLDSLEDTRLKSLEDWRTEWRGSWRLITGTAVVLSIVAAFFAIIKPFIDVVPR
jgi:hypothetical protein